MLPPQSAITGEVRLRPRKAADLDALTDVLAQTHASDRYPMVWPQDPRSWLQPHELAAAWVAEEPGEEALLGHIGVVTGIEDPVVAEQTGPPQARLASVTRLFVAPAARGRGLRLGTRLLDVVSTWAEQNRFRLMLDVVDDGGPAPALYERLGWKPADERRADWLTPDGERLPVRIYLSPAPRHPNQP